MTCFEAASASSKLWAKLTPSIGDWATPQPQIVVLDLSESPDLDVGSLDMLGELADALKTAEAEFRIASVRGPALEILNRGGPTSRVRVEPTLDAALRPSP